MATAVLVVVTGLVGAPHAALADDAGGGNNVVMVVNHEDGALRSRASAAVAQDPGPTVANQNIAVAQATCTGCRTAAAAVQVIIQDGTATDVQPANAAIALNENCNFCQTFAYANQVLLTATAPVALSGDTRNDVQQIDAQMDAVAASSEAFDQMKADLDALTDQLVAVIEADIQQHAAAVAEVGRRLDVREADA